MPEVIEYVQKIIDNGYGWVDYVGGYVQCDNDVKMHAAIGVLYLQSGGAGD